MTDNHRHRSSTEQNMNDNRVPIEAPSPNTEIDPKSRIRELNDRLRVSGKGGMVVMTNGVGALGLNTVKAIFAAIAAFNEFTPDNDPWCEHDFGAVTVEAVSILWKIEYYDRSRRYHSPDPADPKVTVRVLTVMLAEEY